MKQIEQWADEQWKKAKGISDACRNIYKDKYIEPTVETAYKGGYINGAEKMRRRLNMWITELKLKNQQPTINEITNFGEQETELGELDE